MEPRGWSLAEFQQPHHRMGQRHLPHPFLLLLLGVALLAYTVNEAGRLPDGHI